MPNKLNDGKGEQKRCYICKKIFSVPFPDLWAYKSNKKYFCSYGCTTIYLKAHPRANKEVKYG